MTVLKHGKLFKKIQQVVVMYAQGTADEDNAAVVAYYLKKNNYIVYLQPLVGEKIPELKSGVWYIYLGGPVTSEFAKSILNNFSPIKFGKTDLPTPCGKDPSDNRYWAINYRGTYYTNPNDGFVASFLYNNIPITWIAGCTRSGTDLATYEFIKMLEGVNIMKILAIFSVGFALGVLIGNATAREYAKRAIRWTGERIRRGYETITPRT